MTKEKQVPFPHTGILSQQNRKDLLWASILLWFYFDRDIWTKSKHEQMNMTEMNISNIQQ